MGLRRGAVATVLLWVALATGVTLAGGVEGRVIALLWAVVPALALGVWRLAYVPYVALDAREVTVQNRIGRHVVPYAEIVRVHAGYYGVTMRLRSGASLTAWAVQKPNWASWLHKRTRADDLVDALTARVGGAPDGRDGQRVRRSP